ncbi:MAG: hypothetical protein LBB76_02805 [Azoarcus sp.]|jgi:hypothetical protein|nr:hypothetical protein [Azoarcus sp.]
MYNAVMDMKNDINDDVLCQQINWPENFQLSLEETLWLEDLMENPPPHSEFFQKVLAEHRREFGEFPSFDSGF